MSDWWLVGIFLGFLFVIVNSRVDIDSALSLAHCRATCIYKMNLTKLSDQDCRVSNDCSQCWNICRVLQKSHSVCDQRNCVGSCRQSCHWTSTGLSPPVLLKHPLEELTFSATSVSWPLLASTTQNSVYVVMVDHQQYLQTLDLKTKLTEDINPLTVQVLVVDWRGFTKVFTPKPQSPVEMARTLVQQLGLENLVGLNENVGDTNRTLETNMELFKNSYIHSWRLREESRTHHKDFARVQISWRRQHLPTTSRPMYLVTWQVEGGGLRGNLLTNTSRVTLSIGSNALFRIQVALFTQDSPDRASEFLVIDTHHPPREQLHQYFHTYVVHPVTGDTSWEVVVAGATAFLMVLLFTLTWKYHNRWSQPRTKLTHLEVPTPMLSRGYSLKVRGIYKKVKFSSMENLLEEKTTDS